MSSPERKLPPITIETLSKVMKELKTAYPAYESYKHLLIDPFMPVLMTTPVFSGYDLATGYTLSAPIPTEDAASPVQAVQEAQITCLHCGFETKQDSVRCGICRRCLS